MQRLGILQKQYNLNLGDAMYRAEMKLRPRQEQQVCKERQDTLCWLGQQWSHVKEPRSSAASTVLAGETGQLLTQHGD